MNIFQRIKAEINKDNIKEVITYLFVGGAATLVEWAGFYILSELCGIDYRVATSIAFIISTAANWILARLFVFTEPDSKNIWKELTAIYTASAAGLLFNLIIMFVMVEYFHIWEMISKMTATGIVFSYNYLIRKLVIYKKK